MSTGVRRNKWVVAACAIGVSVLTVAGWIGYRTWPRRLAIAAPFPEHPRLTVTDGRLVLEAPAPVVSTVETFRDEILAYLHFEYLCSRPEIDRDRVLLTAVETTDGPLYRIELLLDRDLLTSVPYLADLHARHLTREFGLAFSNQKELGYKRKQTELFVSAYNFPVRRKLESLPSARIHPPLTRFLLFKSKTDRRVRERIQPVPAALSRQEAGQLAADIIAVARFYDLPLDFFLGIGAMENNYMNITGDSGHAVWKRRPGPGDVVLKRRRGRVLVRDYSVGVWQITRETLRYAHKLYLRDTRDYTALPERLRPPEVLDLDAVEPPVLTTYAGLLLRDLLERFNGDIKKAVGAYNGGPRNPNLKYASGVAAAAEHARRVVEQAAVLDGRRVAETQFITSVALVVKQR